MPTFSPLPSPRSGWVVEDFRLVLSGPVPSDEGFGLIFSQPNAAQSAYGLCPAPSQGSTCQGGTGTAYRQAFEQPAQAGSAHYAFQRYVNNQVIETFNEGTVDLSRSNVTSAMYWYSPSSSPSPSGSPAWTGHQVFTLTIYGAVPAGDSFQLRLNTGGQDLRYFCDSAQPGGCPGGGKSYSIRMSGVPQQGNLPYSIERIYSTNKIELIKTGIIDTNVDSIVSATYAYP